MTVRYSPRPDTRSWVMQVWIAFIAAVLLAGFGLANLPGEGADRAFLVVGFLFCLSSSFTLAKTIRDNRDEQVDTPAWIIQTWIAFGVAMLGTAWGLGRVGLDPWAKGYMFATALFLVSSTFVLAKTIRDNHEAALLAGAERPQDS